MGIENLSPIHLSDEESRVETLRDMHEFFDMYEAADLEELMATLERWGEDEV